MLFRPWPLLLGLFCAGCHVNLDDGAQPPTPTPACAQTAHAHGAHFPSSEAQQVDMIDAVALGGTQTVIVEVACPVSNGLAFSFDGPFAEVDHSDHSTSFTSSGEGTGTVTAIDRQTNVVVGKWPLESRAVTTAVLDPDLPYDGGDWAMLRSGAHAFALNLRAGTTRLVDLAATSAVSDASARAAFRPIAPDILDLHPGTADGLTVTVHSGPFSAAFPISVVDGIDSISVIDAPMPLQVALGKPLGVYFAPLRGSTIVLGVSPWNFSTDSHLSVLDHATLEGLGHAEDYPVAIVTGVAQGLGSLHIASGAVAADVPVNVSP